MALTLDDFRKADPTFEGIDDASLAKYLHEQYASDQPFSKFASMVGYEDPEADGDSMRGFKDSFRQIPQVGYGLLAAAGATAENVAGEGGISTAIKNAGIKGYNEASASIAENAKESDSLTYSWEQAKQGNFNALADWLQYGIGYAGGQGLQMLATAGIGSVVAKAGAATVAKEVAEKMVAKETAKLAGKVAAEDLEKIAVANVAKKIGDIGATAAIGASSFGMEGGEIGGDLVTNAEKEGRTLTGDELAKAFGATIGAGAVDFVGDKFGLDVLTGKSKLFKMGESMPGVGGKLARGGMAAGVAAPAEAAQEYGQTLIEEYGKGNDPFSEASKQQALDAAGLGTVGGGAHGVVGGLLSTAKPIAQAKSVDEAIEAAGQALDAPALTYQQKLSEPHQRGNISADAQITFPDGSTTGAFDYFEQRLAAHGDENLARQETFQALNGPVSPYAGPKMLTDSGIVFSGRDNPEGPELEAERFKNDFEFDDSIPLDTNKAPAKKPAPQPTWEEYDLLNEPPQQPAKTEEQQSARKRLLNAKQDQTVPKTETPEPQAQPVGQVQPAESPVSQPTAQGPEAGQDDKAPGFVATHTLDDGGVPVKLNGDGVFEDAYGNEYEGYDATPLKNKTDEQVQQGHESSTTVTDGNAPDGRLEEAKTLLKGKVFNDWQSDEVRQRAAKGVLYGAWGRSPEIDSVVEVLAKQEQEAQSVGKSIFDGVIPVSDKHIWEKSKPPREAGNSSSMSGLAAGRMSQRAMDKFINDASNLGDGREGGLWARSVIRAFENGSFTINDRMSGDARALIERHLKDKEESDGQSSVAADTIVNESPAGASQEDSIKQPSNTEPTDGADSGEVSESQSSNGQATGKSIEQQKIERAQERQAEEDALFKLLPASVKRAVQYRAERERIAESGGYVDGGFNTDKDANDSRALRNFRQSAKGKAQEALKLYEHKMRKEVGAEAATQENPRQIPWQKQKEATYGADMVQLDNAHKETSGRRENESFEQRVERFKKETTDNLERWRQELEKPPTASNNAEGLQDAQHIEGDGIERVTTDVVNDSLTKAADNTPKSKTEMRKWLISEIDKAISKSKDEIGAMNVDDEYLTSLAAEEKEVRKSLDDLERTETRLWRAGESTLLLNADILKARSRLSEIDRLKSNIVSKGMEKQGDVVVFDVPGDGKFRVVNTKDRLESFKAKVLASPGFKETRGTDRKGSAPPFSAKAAVDEFLKDGELVNAYYAAQESGIKLGFGAGRGEHAGNVVYSSVEPLTIEGHSFFVGKRFEKAKKGNSYEMRPIWAVIHEASGQNSTGSGLSNTRDNAIKSATQNIESFAKQNQLEKILERAIDAGKTQDELLKEFKDKHDIQDDSETATAENIKENSADDKQDQSADSDLSALFKSFGKSGFKKGSEAKLDGHPDADLIRNVQAHWLDILADHGYEQDKENGLKGRLSQSILMNGC